MFSVFVKQLCTDCGMASILQAYGIKGGLLGSLYLYNLLALEQPKRDQIRVRIVTPIERAKR